MRIEFDDVLYEELRLLCDRSVDAGGMNRCRGESRVTLLGLILYDFAVPERDLC